MVLKNKKQKLCLNIYDKEAFKFGIKLISNTVIYTVSGLNDFCCFNRIINQFD
jgi:hypothetical protein